MSLQGWQTLTCTCGNDHFNPVLTLSWHETGGTATKPDGYTCTGCGKRSDQIKMIAVVKQRALQIKIDELREQQGVG